MSQKILVTGATGKVGRAFIHPLLNESKYDLKRLTDEAFDYVRADDDPRIVYYPG